jgi:DNA-directed RNA polymerase specialized sigma24 family protein
MDDSMSMSPDLPSSTSIAPEPRGPVSHELLSRPELRRYLEAYVRRRVPGAEADDAVQSVLCAALEARRVPSDAEELRKWLTGIARHKIAALHQRASRERGAELGEVEAKPAPIEEASLLRWALRNVEDSGTERGDETLDWMARESDGEKLESIAEEAKLPAARVRQRVSRLRRWLKARWVAELALAASALVVCLLGIAWLLREGERARRFEVAPPGPSIWVARPDPTPAERALDLRRRALVECGERSFSECLHDLDDAARLDPAGEADPTIARARREAEAALVLQPPPKKIAPSPKTTGTGTPGTGKPWTGDTNDAYPPF